MSDVIQGADAPPMPAPLESPEPVAKSYAQELEEAAADLGPSKPQNGVTLKGKKEKEEPEVEAKSEPAKEPVTQEKLSSGFAKLERQRKAVAKKEAEIAAKEAEIAQRHAEFEKTSTERSSTLESRTADLEKLEKLFEEDEEAFLEAIAAKRKTTTEAFYDKLTRRRLNGGVRAPEDMVADVRTELEATKKKLEDREAAEKSAAEEAAKAKEEQEQRTKFEARIQAENAGFVGYCRSKEGEAAKFPLLSEEKDEDIVGVARQLIQSATSVGKNVSYDDVARYMEQQLSLIKLKEDAEKAESETPKKSAPKPEGKKAEPAKAKTITNSMAAPRSTKSEGTPLTDDDRMERALAAWK